MIDLVVDNDETPKPWMSKLRPPRTFKLTHVDTYILPDARVEHLLPQPLPVWYAACATADLWYHEGWSRFTLKFNKGRREAPKVVSLDA